MDFKGLVGEDGYTFHPEIRFQDGWIAVTDCKPSSGFASTDEADGKRIFTFKDSDGWVGMIDKK